MRTLDGYTELGECFADHSRPVAKRLPTLARLGCLRDRADGSVANQERARLLPCDDAREPAGLFKGRHFEAEVIVLCVRWYLRFGLSFRNLVSANGGPVTPITRMEPSRSEITHSDPTILPDGRHFVYLRRSTAPH